MNECRTCTNRYACEGQFEFECKNGDGIYYHSNGTDRRVSLTTKKPPAPPAQQKKKIPQVKIISNTGAIQDAINEWLKENDSIELIDIKYSVTENWNCAMIIYNTYI